MSACNPQIIWNSFHHLADGTLPPDRWNDTAELAAIVWLAAHHPAHAAFEILCTAVRDYNRVNRSLRLPQLAFDASRAERCIAIVSRCLALRPGIAICEIFHSLLALEQSLPEPAPASLRATAGRGHRNRDRSRSPHRDAVALAGR